MSSRKRITFALVALIALVVVGWFVRDARSVENVGSEVPGLESELPLRALSGLPSEISDTRDRIERGGSFPHPEHDGAVFGNREGELPPAKQGYYREHTVSTPGEFDRGPRRLVTGDSAELYYTNDHYETFVVVDTDG